MGRGDSKYLLKVHRIIKRSNFQDEITRLWQLRGWDSNFFIFLSHFNRRYRIHVFRKAFWDCMGFMTMGTLTRETKKETIWHRNYLSPVSTRRRFDVGTTLFGRQQRCYNVETTSCAYWVLGAPIDQNALRLSQMQYGPLEIFKLSAHYLWLKYFWY